MRALLCLYFHCYLMSSDFIYQERGRLKAILQSAKLVQLSFRGSFLNRFIFCVSFFVLSACGAQSDVQRKGMSLQLSLSVDQAELLTGKVILEPKLSNFTQANVVFLPWNTPFEPSLNGDFFKITHLVGALQPLEYQGLMVKRAAPQTEDYLLIEAGGSLTNRLDITKSYTFCNGVDYKLEFKGVFYTPENRQIDVGLASLEFKYFGDPSDC